MKAATLITVALLLAGTVSSSPAPQEKRPDWLPDWVPSLPEGWFPIDLPDGWFPEGGLPDGWFPDISDLEKPDWLPEIEWEQVKEAIQELVDKIREKIQSIDWENLTWEQVKEVIQEAVEELIERIREILEGIELPPLPELPELPDITINRPVPGEQSSIQQYPSAAQIEIGSGPVWIQAYGGALITNFHVLTAARAFSGIGADAKYRRIRLGASDRYNSGLIYELDSFIVHPSFGSGDNFFVGNIALARTVAPIGFNDAIQSTQIVVADFVVPASLPVVFAGWGNTAEGTYRIPNDDLYSINLVAIDRAACDSKWSSIPLVGDSLSVGAEQFCAGRIETNGRDGDIRDIGGPAYSGDVLIGTLSFSNPLGNQSYPLVFTSISSYTNWIVANAN